MASDDEQDQSKQQGGESKGTVLVAGGANLVIAGAKIVAGLMSGSSAMLAEGAHSIADTMNEGFLLTALSRSSKPADAEHPFGYGKERYFWSLLAAVGIFVLGAGFSFFEGVSALIHPEPPKGVLISFIVLGVSVLFEGSSWLKALRQLHGEAQDRDRGTLEHIRRTPDPTVKTVVYEDSAALVGLVFAAGGLALDTVTGSGRFDGVASILIGCTLIVVAYSLGRQNMRMLIGEAMPPEQRRGIRELIEGTPGVVRVLELLTMRLAPDEILLAIRVDVVDGNSAGDVEQLAEHVDLRIREEFPDVRHVFVDPTPTGSSSARMAGRSNG